MDAYSLSVFWASLIAFSILFYVILDGYDLGVGILFGTTQDARFRDRMMAAISPFWDGNESWLILIGAGLFAAFPMVYSIFLSAFYLPIALMLIALIFRGVAFEFRHHAGRFQVLWDRGFFLGSLLAAFVQGAAIGRMAEGLPVKAGQYAGTSFDWLTPFSVFCGGGLIIGYALLGAGWVVMKTEGDVREWAYARVRWLLIAVLAVLVTVLLWVLGSQADVRNRWLTDIWISVFPLIIAMAASILWTGAKRRIDWVPYGMAVIVFASAFAALEASFWPYMIPYSVTIAQAAAPLESLRFLFYGAGVVLFPLILFYTGMVYWIMRGKV